MNNRHLILGLLVVAGSSANAASIVDTGDSKLDIGGRVEARAESRDSEISDLSRARLKITGETKINESVSAIAMFEHEFKESKQKTRHLYAGIKSDVTNGEVSLVYGKTDGAMSVVTDIADIQAAYGAIASDKIKVGHRIENSLLATYTNDFGTTINANYAGKAGNEKGDFGGGFSVAGSQTMGDTGLIAGMGYAKQSKVGKQGKEQFDLGLGYNVGSFYLGSVYSKQKVKDKIGNGYDVVASYKINKIYKTTIGFGEMHFAEADDSRAVNADITAKWNHNFRTYAAVNYDLVASDTQAMIGARYDF